MIVTFGLGIGLTLFAPSRLAVAALCWGILNLAAVPVVGHFFPHHYVMMFPAIALLGGAVLGHFISQRPAETLAMRFGRGLLAVILLVAAYGYLRPSVDEERPLIAAELARLPGGPAAWTSGPGRPIEEIAGLYIRDHSLPADRIHVHGWNGTALSVYWYADRLPAIPYFYEIPFHLDTRRQLEALQEARPRFVVLIHTPDDRPIRAWLTSGYQLEHTAWHDYKLEVWGRID
jgi:hypothetical protein